MCAWTDACVHLVQDGRSRTRHTPRGYVVNRKFGYLISTKLNPFIVGPGIIHSDLKPNNFLLVAHEIKLIDFNISNSIDDRTSMTVVNDCGTLHYMPPESIQSGSNKSRVSGTITWLRSGSVSYFLVFKIKISLRSDVWSLGCILYMMTYGRLPFQHIKNPYHLMFALCDTNNIINFPPLQDENLMDVLVVSFNSSWLTMLPLRFCDSYCKIARSVFSRNAFDANQMKGIQPKSCWTTNTSQVSFDKNAWFNPSSIHSKKKFFKQGNNIKYHIL